VSESSQFSLLGQRRFAPFFVTQFFGALNDNIFRNGLVILVTFQGILIAGMDHSKLANIAGALFILLFNAGDVFPTLGYIIQEAFNPTAGVAGTGMGAAASTPSWTNAWTTTSREASTNTTTTTACSSREPAS